jgi:serine protease DegQ
MRRFWLLFAQTVTIGLGLYCVLLATRPELLGSLAARARPEVAGPAPIAAPVQAAVGSYRAAAARAMPAVVNILTSKALPRDHPLLRAPFFHKFFGERAPQDELQTSLGSGVLVSADGFILTNNHVVAGADEIEVVLADGRRAPARIVGTDPETDLAVIRIALKALPVIALGQAEQARVGDVVLAIGNPFAVGQTVTMGIISAVGRNNLHINHFENFIQTDAAINFGNSGGALIDTGGNLLGINSAIYSQSGGSVGIGFAIPVSTAKAVMDEIIRNGQVVRGWIGVESQDITPELADSFGLDRQDGAIIAGVVRDGPADRAGMLPGDILLAIDGKSIGSSDDMLKLIAELRPGVKSHMTVVRKKRRATLDVTVGKRPRARE